MEDLFEFVSVDLIIMWLRQEHWEYQVWREVQRHHQTTMARQWEC